MYTNKNPSARIENYVFILPLRYLALLVVVVVYAGAVLRAGVASLPVQRGGVDDVPQHGQQFIIADRRGVVCDLHRTHEVKVVSNKF